jgi:hypothetical protein
VDCLAMIRQFATRSRRTSFISVKRDHWQVLDGQR